MLYRMNTTSFVSLTSWQSSFVARYNPDRSASPRSAPGVEDTSVVVVEAVAAAEEDVAVAAAVDVVAVVPAAVAEADTSYLAHECLVGKEHTACAAWGFVPALAREQLASFDVVAAADLGLVVHSAPDESVSVVEPVTSALSLIS